MADQPTPTLTVAQYPAQPAGSAWIGNSAQALLINSNVGITITVTVNTPGGNGPYMPIVGLAAPVQPNGGLQSNYGAVFFNSQAGPTIGAPLSTQITQAAGPVSNWIIAMLPTTTIPCSSTNLPNALAAPWQSFQLTGPNAAGAYTATMSSGSTSVTIMISMGTGATR